MKRHCDRNSSLRYRASPLYFSRAAMMVSNFLKSSLALAWSTGGYIDLIAKLARARAKFSEVAYRFRPSFFAPGDLLIKATHGQFHLVVRVKHVCPRDDARRPRGQSFQNYSFERPTPDAPAP
jgi:hypothetical protein